MTTTRKATDPQPLKLADHDALLKLKQAKKRDKEFRMRERERKAILAAGLSEAEAAEIMKELDGLVRKTVFFVEPGEVCRKQSDITTKGVIGAYFGPLHEGHTGPEKWVFVCRPAGRSRRWSALHWRLSKVLAAKLADQTEQPA